MNGGAVRHGVLSVRLPAACGRRSIEPQHDICHLRAAERKLHQFTLMQER